MNVPHHPHHRLARALALGLGARGARRPCRERTPSVPHRRGSTWNENAGKAAVAACISPVDAPLHESRLYAMTHVAIHDALNAIDRRSRPYAYRGRAQRSLARRRGRRGGSRRAGPGPGQLATLAPAGASAPASRASKRTTSPRSAPSRDGPRQARGVAVGQAAADAILDLRAGTAPTRLLLGSRLPAGHRAGRVPLHARHHFAFAPGWGEVTPFVLRDSAQFRPGPPHAVTEPALRRRLQRGQGLGGDGVTTPSARTAEQTEIALFWVESSPLQWNRIARTVAADGRLDPWEQARLFGLLNMALADGYIGSSRPSTTTTTGGRSPRSSSRRRTATRTRTPTRAGRRSGRRPRSRTTTRAHAVEGGAGRAVLQRFFGTDRIRFATCSTTLPAGSNCDDAVARVPAYRSFSQAAEENGVSRILVGFHFREAVEVGIEHGRKIGERAVDRFMRPTRR